MTRADAEILNVDDLAELFSCDKETAAARLISGDLPGVKVGRSWIIPRQALLERLNEKAHEEASARRLSLEMLRKDAIARGNTSPSCLIGDPAAIGVFSNRGKRRRLPPKLPPLPSSVGSSPPPTIQEA